MRRKDAFRGDGRGRADKKRKGWEDEGSGGSVVELHSSSSERH